MEAANENNQGIVKPGSLRGMENRRALRDIRNVLGHPPPYPCAVAKRGLTDKTGKEDKEKNPNFVGRRPMTRKFAASLASKPQPCCQEISASHEAIGNGRQKKPIPSFSCSNGSDGCTAIDVDIQMVGRHKKPISSVPCSNSSDSCTPVDLNLPLLMVEEREEMVDGGFKEVEMEDLVVEPLPDIDSHDSNNPLAVVDYVEEIYSYYQRIEVTGCVSPGYMSSQFDINEKMRAILIDWLIEVHYKFDLMEETLFLTINIIDRFLSRQTVVRKKLQLVGVTAMLLACKYEEVSVPIVQDLILISDHAYTREEILDMEKLIVNTLQFNMSVPTPYVFMRRFLKAADSNRKLELLSFFMVELCLAEYQMLKFRPSLLAAAAVYTAQCTLNGFKHWTKTTELHTTYSEDQLLECSKLMVDFHQNAGVGKLTGVHRKYSTFKYGWAAKSEPALFLLDTRL